MYSWSTLLCYQCYYPHQSRELVSPVCAIFSNVSVSQWRVCYQRGLLRLVSWQIPFLAAATQTDLSPTSRARQNIRPCFGVTRINLERNQSVLMYGLITGRDGSVDIVDIPLLTPDFRITPVKSGFTTVRLNWSKTGICLVFTLGVSLGLIIFTV